MEKNIILAGVGGQGILSISYVIDMAALKQGLQFKQAEVHGMSQRGGAVQSHLRFSDSTIYSDLVPKGRADLVLSVEPLESLRYIDYLGIEGTLVCGVDPYINITDYPDLEQVLNVIGSLDNHTMVHAERLAREAGSAKAQNMVLLGAAAPYLGIREDLLEASILELFERKGEKLQRVNIAAFRAGKEAGQAYRNCLKAGIDSAKSRLLAGRLSGGTLDSDAIPLWKDVLTGPIAGAVSEALSTKGAERISGGPDIPQTLLKGPSTDVDELRKVLFS